MSILLSFIIVLIVFTIIADVIMYFNRKNYYLLALEKSKLIKKPLLVIGDPKKGIASKILGPRYGYGDICIDLEPSENNDKVLKEEAISFLKKQSNNSFVIYVSAVLEYIPDIENAIFELQRVSGGDLYIMNIPPYAPVSYLYIFQGDRAKNIIYSAPPNGEKIKYFKNPLNNIIENIFEKDKRQNV